MQGLLQYSNVFEPVKTISVDFGNYFSIAGRDEEVKLVVRIADSNVVIYKASLFLTIDLPWPMYPPFLMLYLIP